jgi:hypothetical protein
MLIMLRVEEEDGMNLFGTMKLVFNTIVALSSHARYKVELGGKFSSHPCGFINFN